MLYFKIALLIFIGLQGVYLEKFIVYFIFLLLLQSFVISNLYYDCQILFAKWFYFFIIVLCCSYSSFLIQMPLVFPGVTELSFRPLL